MSKQLLSSIRTLALVLLSGPLMVLASYGAGVTIVTHGYNGNITGWVNGMASAIPQYYRFPGTNFSLYSISVTDNNGYYLTTTRIGGDQPTKTDSGEIIVELDWSQLAGGFFSTYSTYSVATAVAWGLLQTNLISELGGHALAEMPIHLIGHSRGGSLVSEVSRLLGTNGVWVDHLTTLDPHPLNNDGFVDLPNGVDAPVRTYASVLFHDNYWQNLGDGLIDPVGEPVFGAYVRQLTSLDGGYNNAGAVAPYHSNVHLWYYGTIDFGTPASDTEATIGGVERTNWWDDYEAFGVRAGYYYSLIGGGNRLSNEQPLGPGFPAISDGYNHFTNRTALPSNSGEWPNILRFERLDTNAVPQGGSVPMGLLYEWVRPATSTATVSFYLDDDFNPLNANNHFLGQSTVPGGSSTMSGTLSLPLTATNVGPGLYAIFAKISGGGRSRYLYAPQLVQVLIAPPLTLDVTASRPDQIQIGINGPPGEVIVLEASADLLSWQSLATNTLTGGRWVYQESLDFVPSARYYRARPR